MLKKVSVCLTAAALLAGGAGATAQAAAKKAAAKPAAKGKAAKAPAKAKDIPGTPHKWAIGLEAGYFTANADTDNAAIWGLDVQTKIKKRQSLGLSVTYAQNDLNAPLGALEMSTLGIHLSLLGHVGEDEGNRQPGFYWGGGPSLVRGEVDTAGSETELGFHLRAGVEYKGGGYTELRWVDTGNVSNFNGARLGGLSLSAGYRFSL